MAPYVTEERTYEGIDEGLVVELNKDFASSQFNDLDVH